MSLNYCIITFTGPCTQVSHRCQICTLQATPDYEPHLEQLSRWWYKYYNVNTETTVNFRWYTVIGRPIPRSRTGSIYYALRSIWFPAPAVSFIQEGDHTPCATKLHLVNVERLFDGPLSPVSRLRDPDGTSYRILSRFGHESVFVSITADQARLIHPLACLSVDERGKQIRGRRRDGGIPNRTTLSTAAESSMAQVVS